MDHILNGYGAMGVFHSHKHTPVNHMYTLCNLEQALFLTLNGGYANNIRAYLLHFKHIIHNQMLRCIAVQGGIFKNLLQVQVSVN
jgi:hypothetical protein